MKPASLFIGRWQPFHEGHQALIESVLKTGKPVVVAIRDTPPSKNNPFSTSERWAMIQDALQKWGSLVRIIVIPDIDEVCYGRDVGYGIRSASFNGNNCANDCFLSRCITYHTIDSLCLNK